MAKIAYVEHPVTPEQKASLRAQGYRIVDAKFAPDGAEILGAVPDAAVVNPELERLRDVAAGYGVEVDGRWGVDRLNDEIEMARTRMEAETAPNATQMPTEA